MNNEPVAWMKCNTGTELEVDWLPNTLFQKLIIEDKKDWIPLYTHPAKTLTDEEIEKEFYKRTTSESGLKFESMHKSEFISVVREILRKASEK